MGWYNRTRIKFKFSKLADSDTSKIGPSVPVRDTTLLIVPITMSGGAREFAPPAEIIGDPTATSPNRG
jgi:hypothetical protein